MRFLIFIVLLALLVLVCGCTPCNSDNAESLGLRAGTEVTIQKGFYKGCTGVLTKYDDYCSMSDTVDLAAVSCQEGKITMNTLTVKATEIRK